MEGKKVQSLARSSASASDRSIEIGASNGSNGKQRASAIGKQPAHLPFFIGISPMPFEGLGILTSFGGHLQLQLSFLASSRRKRVAYTSNMHLAWESQEVQLKNFRVTEFSKWQEIELSRVRDAKSCQEVEMSRARNERVGAVQGS